MQKTATGLNMSYHNDKEDNRWELCLQVREVTAPLRKLVSLWLRIGSAIAQHTWTAESKIMRCVLEISREEQTAARYNFF